MNWQALRASRGVAPRTSLPPGPAGAAVTVRGAARASNGKGRRASLDRRRPACRAGPHEGQRPYPPAVRPAAAALV